MIPLFLGLTALNLLLLAAVYALGLGAIGVEGVPTEAYALHIALAIIAGLVCALTHVAVFTYFMATAKWLHAATDKGALDAARYVGPALARKWRAFIAGMAAVGLTFLTMLAGAGADPLLKPLWPAEVHLALAVIAITANLAAAAVEYRLISAQGRLMDQVLAILNREPNVQVSGS